MAQTTYDVSHDETLKWHVGDKAYCLHIMQDDDPDSPIEDTDIVHLAFFGRHKGMGNDDRTTKLTPDEYLVQLCRDHVDPASVMDKIRNGQIPEIHVKTEHDGLVTFKDVTNNDEFECVHPESVIDVLADNWTITHCLKMLDEYVHIQKVWAYEHSGITISTGTDQNPYNDQFDSGWLGFAFITKQDIITNWPDCDDNWKEKAANIINATVEEYDTYLNGDVYGYNLYETKLSNADANQDDTDKEPDWEQTESCWGFIGTDIIQSGLAESVGNGLTEAIKDGRIKSGTVKTMVITTYLFGQPE